MSDAERFWSRVQQTDDCWLWLGAKSGNGYGRFRVFGKQVPAHRWAWESVNGPMGSSLIACHSCDVPLCVNPDHIWPGSQRQNIQDMSAKGRGRKRLTHCKRGHEFTESNVHVMPSGKRRCRVCKRMHEAARGPRNRKRRSAA